FTDMKHSIATVFFWIRCRVPGFDFVATEVDVFYFRWRARDLLRGMLDGLTAIFGFLDPPLPLSFGLLSSYLEPLSVNMCRKSLGGIRICLGQDATIRFGFRFIHFTVVEGIEWGDVGCGCDRSK